MASLPIAPDGVRIPRWLVVAALFAAGLIGAGVAYGRRIEASDGQLRGVQTELRVLGYRQCRLEVGLSEVLRSLSRSDPNVTAVVEPWPGCSRPLEDRFP